MMLIVSIIVVLTVLISFVVVEFVLTNRAMFETPFDIVLRVPLTEWGYTWEKVNFIYIVGGSILLGAGIIVLSVVIFDAKRKLKIRSLRKELKQLEKAISEAKTVLAQQRVEEQPLEAPFSASVERADASPDEITKSFEHAVEGGDFAQNMAQDAAPASPEEPPIADAPAGEAAHALPEESPIEAEVVEPERKARDSAPSDDPASASPEP